MQQPIVQADFGGFNPRFPGITVKVASQEALKALHDYLVAPAGGVPPARSLQEIALRSVLEHEVRHYHDALVSPYANGVFRLRVQAVLAGVQALSLVKDAPGELLPLPLGQWLTTPERTRAALADEWQMLLPLRDGGAPWRAVPLPALDEAALLAAPAEAGLLAFDADDAVEGLALTTRNAVGAYRRIDQITAGFLPPQVAAGSPELEPYNVFECLALCVQLHAIWHGQDEAETIAFAGHLLESPLPYAELWRRVFGIANVVTPPIDGHEEGIRRVLAVTRQMMAMAQWAVLGYYARDGMAACPTVRLAALINGLEASDEPESHFAIDIPATWDRWDREIADGALMPWRDAVGAATAQTERMQAMYGRLHEQWQAGPRVPEFIDGVLARHAADRRAAAQLLLDDTESFVNPAAYVRLPHGTLPQPLVRLEVIDGVIPLADFAGGPYVPDTTWTVDGVECANRWILKFGRDAGFEARQTSALAFERLAQQFDVAFSWHPVPADLQPGLLRDIERSSGKRVIHLV